MQSLSINTSPTRHIAFHLVQFTKKKKLEKLILVRLSPNSLYQKMQLHKYQFGQTTTHNYVRKILIHLLNVSDKNIFLWFVHNDHKLSGQSISEMIIQLLIGLVSIN